MKPLRFSLTTLLVITGGLCALLATSRLIPPLGTWTLALFLFAVAAHVAGNAIGTKLRDRGSRSDGPGAARDHYQGQYDDQLTANDFAPATELRHKSSLSRKILWVTLTTAIVGSLGGAVWLSWANRASLTMPGLLFGAAAFGVIGGLAGFLGSSFLLVLGNASAE